MTRLAGSSTKGANIHGACPGSWCHSSRPFVANWRRSSCSSALLRRRSLAARARCRPQILDHVTDDLLAEHESIGFLCGRIWQLTPLAQDDLMCAVAVCVGENADPRMRREAFKPGQVVGQREISDDREASGLADRGGDVLRLNEDVVVIVA